MIHIHLHYFKEKLKRPTLCETDASVEELDSTIEERKSLKGGRKLSQ